MAIATILFEVDIGVASMIAAAFLAIAAPHSQKGAVDRVAWSTVLLSAVVVTYVTLLPRVGTLDAAGDFTAVIGSYEERRVGKERVSTCRLRGAQLQEKPKEIRRSLLK